MEPICPYSSEILTCWSWIYFLYYSIEIFFYWFIFYKVETLVIKFCLSALSNFIVIINYSTLFSNYYFYSTNKLLVVFIFLILFCKDYTIYYFSLIILFCYCNLLYNYFLYFVRVSIYVSLFFMVYWIFNSYSCVLLKFWFNEVIVVSDSFYRRDILSFNYSIVYKSSQIQFYFSNKSLSFKHIYY